MEEQETEYVLLELVELKVGAQQWKPFEATFAPTGENVIVAIAVPKDSFLLTNKGLAMNIEGVTIVARKIADAFDEMNSERIESKKQTKFLQRKVE